MTTQGTLPSIIHSATVATPSAHTYTQVYAGATLSPVINGVTVLMAAGSTINIKVKSISATANVFVLGNKTVALIANPNLNPTN